MTPAQIVRAFGERLMTLPDAPAIVWEDQDANPARPVLSVQHVPAIRQERGLAGGALWQTGYFVVTVHTTKGGLANEAHGIAAAILAHFPRALKLDGLTITGARLASAGYPDGADWRLPVRVDYRIG